ncbi:MAG: Beta-N-acetylhexosaminidase, partial [Mucilaginibacter sp.]|nr:Beta-N-acetylhexosaminidase [Mucilaginibacter sp.]
MKNLLFIIILVILSSPVSFAQQNHINPSTKAFNLKWEIIENNHSNKLQSLSALTLLTSDELIPAYGWKLYFNFAEQILPDSTTSNLKITPINGDLFCLSPTESFKGIKANDSLRISLVSTGWLTNITDAPHGFYLIWDNAPQQYYKVNISVKPTSGPKQYMRSPQDKVGLSTPELVYEQNKNIRNIPADSLVKIFPTPDSSQVTSDKFILDASVAIYADPAFKSEAANLKTELLKLLIPVPDRVKAQKNYIKLIKKPMAPEAYELVINNNSISIASSSGAGIFYGMQSLKTLLPAQAWHHPQKTIIIPGLKVKDKPRFAYRALMLDVARNFQPKMEIIKLLDVMALYKLNVLHFHLCDDEGWRLEIPALPELTVVGSNRGHTLTNKQYLQPTVGSGPFVHTLPGSGYYSRADFIDLLRYANEKHITIIPEIESPGHARAAIKAMDARYDYFYQKGEKEQARQYLLHDLQDTSKYISVQHYNDNVIDVSLPSTYNFIETVTGEIEKMYQEAGAPLKSIHYGGDEVPAGVWERSPSFLSLMKTDTAIKSTDDLWGYYYNRVNNILQKH